MSDLFKYYCEEHGYHSQKVCPCCDFIRLKIGDIFLLKTILGEN
jgi:hypothetical protein